MPWEPGQITRRMCGVLLPPAASGRGCGRRTSLHLPLSVVGVRSQPEPGRSPHSSCPGPWCERCESGFLHVDMRVTPCWRLQDFAEGSDCAGWGWPQPGRAPSPSDPCDAHLPHSCFLCSLSGNVKEGGSHQSVALGFFTYRQKSPD